MVSQIDDIEDDWEILRREPDASAFPTTLNIAEAIERICKAVVDFAILMDDNPWTAKKTIVENNKFPVFTIIPYYDIANKQQLWKVSIAYEVIDLKYSSEAHDCCEKAVEQLFSNVSKSILAKAIQYSQNADNSEKEANAAKDVARKLRRLSSGMGTYSLVQPNLDLKVNTG
jgi:hypothetical protein